MMVSLEWLQVLDRVGVAVAVGCEEDHCVRVVSELSNDALGLDVDDAVFHDYLLVGWVVVER
jgi:hypothetical protein